MKKTEHISERYNSSIFQITLAGMFIGLVIIVSALTGLYLPKIPIFNGRPDFWGGIAILGGILIKDKKIRIIYFIALPFAMIPTELNSYAGFADYMLSVAVPLMTLLILLLEPKRIYQKIIWAFITLIIMFAIKFICLSASGVIFWQTPWEASMIYNAPNVGLDCLVSLPFIFVPLIRLIKLKR